MPAPFRNSVSPKAGRDKIEIGEDAASGHGADSGQGAESGQGETHQSAASGQGGAAAAEVKVSLSSSSETERIEQGQSSTVTPLAVPCFDSEASGHVCSNVDHPFTKYDYRRAALADMTEEVDDGVIRAIMPRLLALPPALHVRSATFARPT